MITSDSEYLKEMKEWFQHRVDIGEDTQLPADADMFSAKMYIANLEAENFEMNKYKKAIQEYIRQQLKEDLNYEQLTMREVIDPFTGEQVKGNK